MIARPLNGSPQLGNQRIKSIEFLDEASYPLELLGGVNRFSMQHDCRDNQHEDRKTD